MKTRILLSGLLALALCSCARETVPEQLFEETLSASLQPVGKVFVNNTGKSVWNTGDNISVFVSGGPDELWEYEGKDGAASGLFTHISDTYRFYDMGEICAVYPYSAGAVLSEGKVPVSLNSGAPLLAAVSSDMNLVFDYMTSVVRIRFNGEVEVTDFVMKGNGGEKFCTSCYVDFSGLKPALGQNGESVSLEIPGGSASEFYLNVPPIAFPAGFTVDVRYSSGEEQTVRYTPAVSLSAGDVLDIDVIAPERPSLVLDVDFRPSCPFKESMPTGGGSGTTSPARTDRNYTLEQDGVSYTFGVHAGYYEYPEGHEKAGTLEYGCWRTKDTYFTESTVYCLHIGRAGSYIKFPVVEGKKVSKFEYMVGNSTKSLYLSADSEGKNALSVKPETANLGEVNTLEVDGFKRDSASEVYLYMSGGNYLIPWFKIYYL